MSYKPHREYRFHDIWDLIHFIEENQCEACYFRKNPHEHDLQFATDYPMCYEIEGSIMSEEPVEELDDAGDSGVVCKRFKLGDPQPPDDPHQLSLLGES